MKPVKVPITNAVFKLSGGTEENDLPINKTTLNGQEVLRSFWKLEPYELEAIKQGAMIELTVWGTQHPPVSLGIGTNYDMVGGTDGN